MISDFGLCKKLMHGKNSVTCQTGAIGTDGWIAPEMFKPENKMVRNHATNYENLLLLIDMLKVN